MSRRSGAGRQWATPARPPQQHQCSVCGKVGPWGPAWQWYGSLFALDEGEPIVRTCSATCRVEAKRLKLVPRNARDSE